MCFFLFVGTFGRVSLVQDKKSKAVYALKAMMKSEIVAHKQQANVINEKDIMIKSNHPFILRLYQVIRKIAVMMMMMMITVMIMMMMMMMMNVLLMMLMMMVILLRSSSRVYTYVCLYYVLDFQRF